MTTSRVAGPAWLFVPADRPDRFPKALAAADAVIIDLEDGVAPERRAHARRGLAQHAAALDPDRVLVRINPLGGADAAADLEAVAAAGLTTIMVPKAESARDLAGLGGWRIIALCETARGILAADALAGVPGVVGLMWGSVDLAADLGGVERDSAVLDHARWQVLLAARANAVMAIDHVVVQLADRDLLVVDARRAAAGGFDAKACVHPDQVGPIRAAFAVDEESFERARRLLASATGPGAQRVDGQLVDRAVLDHARRITARDRSGSGDVDHDAPSDR